MKSDIEALKQWTAEICDAVMGTAWDILTEKEWREIEGMAFNLGHFVMNMSKRVCTGLQCPECGGLLESSDTIIADGETVYCDSCDFEGAVMIDENGELRGI